MATPVTDSARSHVDAAIVESDIPARLDRLPWGRFHTLVVVALGITWILDGLEVTLAGAVSPALKESAQLHFSNADVGLASSAYLAGAVLGALFFGWLTDRLGRKRLFFITLAVYLLATAATALSWNLLSFMLFRFFTGAGIGGEYTAINSAIQELVPSRYRGWTDLVINGSFWIGTALGAAGSIVLLDPAVLAPDWGWRFAFLIGALLGLVIFFMRLWLPESPRWLMTHGREREAAAILDRIEAELRGRGHRFAREPLPVLRLRVRRFTPLSQVFTTLFRTHRLRTFVGLSLMAAQAFFYNAIFFTYALVLTDFYGIRADHVGWYLLPFAAGNFLGPVCLGAARGCRLPLRHRSPVGGRPDRGVDGHLLRGLGGGELGLSHGERNFSARDPRAGHRFLLRHRHRHRRHRGPLVVRGSDRYPLALQRIRGLSPGLAADAGGGLRRGALGRGRGAKAARDRGPPAGGGGLNPHCTIRRRAP